MNLSRCSSIKLVAAVLTLLIVGASSALADQVVYSISVPSTNNPAYTLPAYPGPYATATVLLMNSTTAKITFQSIDNGKDLFLLGDGGAVAVNINAATWTLGTINTANTASGFTPGPWMSVTTGGFDGLGTLNQKIASACPPGFLVSGTCTYPGTPYSQSATEIDFTVTDTSGTWSSAANVLTPNPDGHHFVAAHIYVCADGTTGCTYTGGNGYVAQGYATVAEAGVPVLLSLMLTSSLCMVELTRRFRRRCI